MTIAALPLIPALAAAVGSAVAYRIGLYMWKPLAIVAIGLGLIPILF